MKRDLLKFLFGESQIDGELSALVEDIADIDTEGASDLKVEKAPLAKALKSLGIDADGLENDPRGLSLVIADGESYRSTHAILNTPDSIHKLAQGGWVFSTQGDVAQINEPGEWRIRFLEIATAEANNENPKPTSGTAKNTKISAVIKKAREFASKKPEHYDTNPVENDGKGSDSNKGVGDAKDGAAPEGKPKGVASAVGEAVEKKYRRVKCDSCDALAINGHATHEHGCPKSKRPWVHSDDGEYWVPGDEPEREDYDESKSSAEETVNSLLESGHKAGCKCSFCKNKGNLNHHPKSDEDSESGGVDSGDSTSDSTDLREGAHKAGCACGFCKNKGSFRRNVKDGKDDPEEDEKDEQQFRKDRSASPEGDAVRKKLGMDDGKVEHTFDSLQTPTAVVDKLLLDGAAGFQDIPVQKPGFDIKKRLKAQKKRRSEALENPGTPPGITGHKSYPTMKISSPDRKFVPAKGMVQAKDEGSEVNSQTKRHDK